MLWMLVLHRVSVWSVQTAVHCLCQPGVVKDKLGNIAQIKQLVLPDIPLFQYPLSYHHKYCIICKMHVPILSCQQWKARLSPAKFCKASLVFHSLKPEPFSRGGHGNQAQFGWDYPSPFWKDSAAKCWSEPALHTLHKVSCALFFFDLHFVLQFCTPKLKRNAAVSVSAPRLRVRHLKYQLDTCYTTQKPLMSPISAVKICQLARSCFPGHVEHRLQVCWSSQASLPAALVWLKTGRALRWISLQLFIWLSISY